VPKILINADGTLGERNDVRCVSIEHKLGIHASPTCVMSFGEQEGAVGFLVGEENKGLAHMFTMMNEARQKVGSRDWASPNAPISRRATTPRSVSKARPVGHKAGERVAIIHHPDVRRMLMSMKTQIEAMRAFAYVMAADMDFARRHPDPAERGRRQARVSLLIPVLKGWCSELAIEIASTGIQVHGGMGYIEETGASQYLRDSRIASIYEGTTGIQAADLVGRKLAPDQGEAMTDLIREIRAIEAKLGGERSRGTQSDPRRADRCSRRIAAGHPVGVGDCRPGSAGGHGGVGQLPDAGRLRVRGLADGACRIGLQT